MADKYGNTIYQNCGKVDDPKAYNQKNTEFRYSLESSRGCVGARACENCGTVNAGTCMCIGIFTCCDCGFENGKDLPWLNNNFPINISTNNRFIYLNTTKDLGVYP